MQAPRRHIGRPSTAGRDGTTDSDHEVVRVQCRDATHHGSMRTNWRRKGVSLSVVHERGAGGAAADRERAAMLSWVSGERVARQGRTARQTSGRTSGCSVAHTEAETALFVQRLKNDCAVHSRDPALPVHSRAGNTCPAPPRRRAAARDTNPRTGDRGPARDARPMSAERIRGLAGFAYGY